jgi:hypothetical protein
MIRIRYRGSNELSPGLHAEAEQHGRRTTVYLLSGLNAAERRSALRRLRLTARMGHCPRLPAGQLAFALLMDRMRTGVGRTGAVLRLHPAGSTVPIMVLSGGAIAFLLFSTVSIHVLRPRATDQAGTSPIASASAISLGGGPAAPGAGRDGRGGSSNPHGTVDPGGASRGSDTGQLTRPSDAPVTTPPVLAAGGGGGGVSDGSGSTGSGRTGSGGSATSSDSSGKSSGGGTTLSGSANQTSVTPRQSTPATSAPAPAPAATTPATTPSTSSSGSSSGTSNGVCVNVGPLGVCLNI